MSPFDISKIEKELEKLENKTLEPNFWNDSKKSKIVLSKIKILKDKKDNFTKIEKELKNLEEMNEMLLVENDESLINDILVGTKKIEKDIENLEIKTLLSGKYDQNNAIITLHPGAGGTESQDWAEMLYRMYTRWATSHGYIVKELDYLEGDEAGIKSVTALIEGEYAYGYLKAEKGVHRLVRISPFDAGGRRHTSFASLEVLPEITDDIEIEINPDEISEFSINRKEKNDKGTEYTYECSCKLTKADVKYTLQIEYYYDYGNEWKEPTIDINPVVNTEDINLSGKWIGTYNGAGDDGSVELNITSDDGKNYSGTYSYTPNESYGHAGSYNVSGTFEGDTMQLTLTAGDWISKPDKLLSIEKQDVTVRYYIDDSKLKATAQSG